MLLPLRLMPQWIRSLRVHLGECTLVLTHPRHLRPALEVLKAASATQYSLCVDVTAVDFPAREARFEVVYHLLSLPTNQRLRLKLAVAEDGAVDSIAALYPSANWFERETWDMFGIPFTGHPDLRRILTDYGFDGHPLRKDFPLSGHVEFKYDETKKRVIAEPVQLAQQFRTFHFRSPWELLPQTA